MKKVEPIRDVDDIERIKDYLRGKNERNYVLFMFGIYSGMRIGDILPLKVRDVRGNHVDITERKTGKTKRFAINPQLKKALNHYISENNLKDYDYLFPSRKRNKVNGIRLTPLTRQGAYEILKDAGNVVGLTKLGTHSMRKTFGYHFYNQTQDVVKLMNIFNHASPDITLIYIGYRQDELDSAMLTFDYYPP